MAKILTSIIAENLSQITEYHHLLPKNHFGGRPGQSAMDAIHYLIYKIHSAWRSNKVVSALFLDVEGAFPNVSPKRLIHNLRKKRIPTSIVKFVKSLLSNRRTRLRFNNFKSDTIQVQNSIGQGNLLSILLYIYYNTDLLNIPTNTQKKDTMGYINDITLLSIGNNFTETTEQIEDIMVREDGRQQWSIEHNSFFGVSKSAIAHFSRKMSTDPRSNNPQRLPLSRPELTLDGQIVQEVKHYKYLGILIDTQLRWKEQEQRAAANATKWILQFRRLSRPSTGVSIKLMRQLYLAVVMPKIIYGIKTWYTPPTRTIGQTKRSRSVEALQHLQKAQRIATLAITGTLRSTPNDHIEIHANILPMELALLKAYHNAITHILTLPELRPLNKIVLKKVHNKI